MKIPLQNNGCCKTGYDSNNYSFLSKQHTKRTIIHAYFNRRQANLISVKRNHPKKFEKETIHKL